MPNNNGMCVPEWQAAKQNFETKTDKKKPSKKFLGLRVGTKIEAALKKMDPLYVKIGKTADAKKRLKLIAKYEDLVKGFRKIRLDYKVVLRKAAQDEQDKDGLVKEINVLSKTLSATESGADAMIQKQRQATEDRIEAEAAGNVARDKEAIKAKAIRNLAKGMAPSLKSAIKNGMLFIAKIKADPTPEAFNTQIQGAARRLGQNMGNLPKIHKQTGEDFGLDMVRMVGAVKILEPWAADRRKVKQTADAKAVLRELRNYEIVMVTCKMALKQIQANPFAK